MIGGHFVECGSSTRSGILNIIDELLVSMIDTEVLTQTLITIVLAKPFHKPIVNSGPVSVHNGPRSYPGSNQTVEGVCISEIYYLFNENLFISMPINTDTAEYLEVTDRSMARIVFGFIEMGFIDFND